VCGSSRDERALSLEIGEDGAARLEPLHAAVARGHLGDVEQPRVAVEDVDKRKPVPAADLEVVEVVRGRDLHRPGPLRGVRVRVGDDRDAPARERQDRLAADQGPVALVVRVHGDGGVAEHRLRPRGRDRDRKPLLSRDGVANLPERPLHLAVLHLKVGDR
jgi:hypothetical protein